MWDVMSRVGKTAWDVMSGVTKTAWDIMSGVRKTAWDVLSGVANLCGMFCPGCHKMAWDVLSRDVLSGFRRSMYPDFVTCEDQPAHRTVLSAPLFLEKNMKHFVGQVLGPNCLLN